MSGHEIETLVRFLDGANHVADQAPRPDNAEDADEVLSSLHQLLTTTEGLHDQIAGCFGTIDASGRCADCGRLVVVGAWRLHEPGGCLSVVRFAASLIWLLRHRDAIPVVGQVIWRLRNRSATHPVSASSEPPSDRGGDQ